MRNTRFSSAHLTFHYGRADILEPRHPAQPIRREALTLDHIP